MDSFIDFFLLLQLLNTRVIMKMNDCIHSIGGVFDGIGSASAGSGFAEQQHVQQPFRWGQSHSTPSLAASVQRLRCARLGSQPRHFDTFPGPHPLAPLSAQYVRRRFGCTTGPSSLIRLYLPPRCSQIIPFRFFKTVSLFFFFCFFSTFFKIFAHDFSRISQKEMLWMINKSTIINRVFVYHASKLFSDSLRFFGNS